MGGLLAGLGQGLAKGIEAGAKVYAEGTLEQIKQDASERREMNLARITNLFADERQASSQKHELGMAKTRATHELGMAETERTFRVAQAAEVNRLAIALEKEKDTDARARIKIEYKNALEVARVTAKLSNEEMAVLEKNYNFFMKIMPKEEAKAVMIASLREATTEKERAQLTAWANMYTTDVKAIAAGGIPPTAAQKEEVANSVTATLGYSPSDLFLKKTVKPPPPGESEFAQAKREKAEKAAEQAKLAAEKAKKGLISGAQVPPSGINVYEQ